MRRATSVLLAWIGVTALGAGAEEVPFKLGTFEERGRTFVGLVRRDQSVVDIGLTVTVGPTRVG